MYLYFHFVLVLSRCRFIVQCFCFHLSNISSALFWIALDFWTVAKAQRGRIIYGGGGSLIGKSRAFGRLYFYLSRSGSFAPNDRIHQTQGDGKETSQVWYISSTFTGFCFKDFSFRFFVKGRLFWNCSDLLLVHMVTLLPKTLVNC